MDYIIMENGEKILLETQQKVTIQRTVDIYKQYRKELGLTQSELGKRAGISQPNITRFESGNYNPICSVRRHITIFIGNWVHILQR